MRELAEVGGYPVTVLSRDEDGGQPSGLYLSAGVHGDEPAGVLGLLGWAERNTPFLKSRPVVIFPCLNPWGLFHNSRFDPAGRDLNRSFDRRRIAPVRQWRVFMRGRRFGLAVVLHEDYESRGIYLYESTRPGLAIGDAILEGAEAWIPRHVGGIDGRKLRHGILRRARGLDRIAREIDGLPEAIALALHHAPAALTFETPSEFSLYHRVMAQEAFLEALAERV